MAKDIRENLDYTKGIRNEDLYGDSDTLSIPEFDDPPQTKVKENEQYLGTDFVPTERALEIQRQKKSREDLEKFDRETFGRRSLIESEKTRRDVLNEIFGYSPTLYEPERLDIREGIGDYGRHSRERKNSPNMFGTYEQLMDERAYLQPSISKLFNGIGKGVINLVSTFATSVGTYAWGLMTAPAMLDPTVKNTKNLFAEENYPGFKSQEDNVLDEQGRSLAEKSAWTKVWERIWNNEITNTAEDFKNWSERVMPNYYSSKELNADNFFDNFFTANFWGDKFFKNLGFSIGAFYSGKLFTGMLGKFAQASKARATATQVLGSLYSAVGEGVVEAKTNADQWEQLEIQKANDEYIDKIALLKKKYGDNSDITDMSVLEQKAPKELAQAKAEYQQKIAKIKVDAAHVGNVILTLNIPTLTVSNFIRFAKQYTAHYDPFSGYAKTHTGGRLARSMRSAGTRRLRPLKYGYRSLWKSLGIKEGRFTNFIERAPKQFFAEGAEEWMQRAEANLASLSYSQDVQDFIKYGSDYKEKSAFRWVMDNARKSFIYTWNEQGANGAVEEFFIGGLNGMLGIPGLRRMRDSKGRLRSPIYLQGSPIADAFSRRNGKTEDEKNKEDLEKMHEIMNKFVKTAVDKKSMAEYLKTYIEGIDFTEFEKFLQRYWFIEEDATEAVKNGDKLAYEQAMLKEVIAAVTAFRVTGRIKDFKQLLELNLKNLDLSEKDVDDLIEVTKTPEGNSPFIVTEGESTRPMTPQEAEGHIRDNTKNLLKTIDRMDKTAGKILANSMGQIRGERLNNLLYLREMYDQYADKAKEQFPQLIEMFKKLRDNEEEKIVVVPEGATKELKDKQREIKGRVEALDYIIKKAEAARNRGAEDNFLRTMLGNPTYRELLSDLHVPFAEEMQSGDFESYMERINMLSDTLYLTKYLTEYNKLFNKYLDEEQYNKDIEELNKREKTEAEKALEKDVYTKLKERISDTENPFGLSDIEEIVGDSVDIEGLLDLFDNEDDATKNTLGKEMETAARFLRDIVFKRNFKDFLDNNRVQYKQGKVINEISQEEKDDMMTVLNAVKDYKKGVLREVINKLNKSIPFVIESLEKAGKTFETPNAASTYANDLVNKMKSAYKQYKNYLKEQQRAPSSKPEPKSPIKPEEKNASVLSATGKKISESVQKAIEDGDYDLRSLLDEYSTEDLIKYLTELKKAEETSTDFSQVEKDEKNKALIADEIESLIKDRKGKIAIDTVKDDAVPVKAEEARKIEQATSEAQAKTEEGQRSTATFRNWTVTAFDWQLGKEDHEKQKVDYFNALEKTIWEAFRIQELIDSGDLAKIADFTNMSVRIFAIPDNSKKKTAYNFYVGFEAADSALDKIDKGGKKYPRIKIDGKSKSSYILVGSLGANSFNEGRRNEFINSILPYITHSKRIRTVKNPNDGNTYAFNITDRYLPVMHFYSGRFEKNLDDDKKEIYSEVSTIDDNPIFGLVFVDASNSGNKIYVLGNNRRIKFVDLNKFVMPGLREGMLVVGVRGADGLLYPSPVVVKRFTPSELPETHRAVVAVKEAIKKYVAAVMDDNVSLMKKMEAYRELKSLLHFGNNSIHFNSAGNGGMEFKIYEGKNDPTPERIRVGKNDVDGGAEELFKKLYSERYNFPFNVSIRDYGKAYKLGVLTTDLKSLQNFNASLDFGDVQDNNQGTPVSRTHTGNKEDQNKPTDVIINGHRVSMKSRRPSMEKAGLSGLVPNDILTAISQVLEVEAGEDLPQGMYTKTITEGKGTKARKTTMFFKKVVTRDMQEVWIAINRDKTGNNWEIRLSTSQNNDWIEEAGKELEAVEALKSPQNPEPQPPEEPAPSDPGLDIATSLDDENPAPEPAPQSTKEEVLNEIATEIVEENNLFQDYESAVKKFTELLGMSEGTVFETEVLSVFESLAPGLPKTPEIISKIANALKTLGENSYDAAAMNAFRTEIECL